MRQRTAVFYLIMILLGVLGGLSDAPAVHIFAESVSTIFIRFFKCLSTPIIALSLIVTIAMYSGTGMGKLWKKTILNTISTTLIAALVSMGLYLYIQPANISQMVATAAPEVHQTSYFMHLANLVPVNFFSPFIDNQVMSVLFLGLLIGFAIRQIPDTQARQSVMMLFKGLHSLMFVLTKWVVTILPIGLFAFICVSVNQLREGMNFASLSQYLLVILLANVIQGFVVLPLWLKWKGIPPINAFKRMLPALLVAFFSKSSTGTLPLTMETAEKRLNVRPEVSRFVLPLCTSLNMNGCAAFIFTTVIYVMQNNGMPVTPSGMVVWALVATVAAVGNAGVPMGCFLLSASLLSSMNVSIVLLGIILPFYSVIDMIETALNVWSDACVTAVVDKEIDFEDVPLQQPASATA